MRALLFFLLISSPVIGAEILLPGGTYYENEVKPGSYEGWYGVYVEPGGHQVRKVTFEIKPFKHPETGNIIDGQVFIWVKQLSKGAPIFMVRGLALKEGRIPGVTVKSILDQGYREETKIGRQVCTLKVITDELVLRCGEKDQPIARLTQGLPPSYRPRVLWTGDLDGDEKLDLLLNLRRDTLVTDVSLFLSSQAKPITRKLTTCH